MRYDLIFYLSKKTSYCEKRIKKILSDIGLIKNRVLYCIDSITLGSLTCESLTLTNLVILVGGLNAEGDSNMSVILSRVLSSTGLTLDNVKKLKSNDLTAYVISYESQVILALPDSPDDIQNMITDDFKEFLIKTINK